MKPGRELDALVAEKVMGWTREGADAHWRPEHRPSLDYPGRIIDNWDSKGPHDFLVRPGGSSSRPQDRVAFCGCEGSLEVPPYSTEIAAAWEVVEKINSSKNKWTLNSLRCDPNDGKWQFGDIDRDGSIWPDDKYDSAPLAICLAALKAVGVEV